VAEGFSSAGSRGAQKTAFGAPLTSSNHSSATRLGKRVHSRGGTKVSGKSGSSRAAGIVVAPAAAMAGAASAAPADHKRMVTLVDELKWVRQAIQDRKAFLQGQRGD
jgi:hypothetical protein